MTSVSLFALVLAVSACGGPSDASVIARGNAICSQTLAAIRVVPGSAAGVSTAATIVAREVRSLRGLPRPKSHLATLDAFIAAEAALSREYSAYAGAERTSDQSAETSADAALASAATRAASLARRYGLSRCAAAGPTVGS